MTDPILVAIDGRDASSNALDFAIERAYDCDTGLHVVHVSSGDEYLEQQIQKRIEDQVNDHPNGEEVVVNVTFLDAYDKSLKPAENISRRLHDYLEDNSTQYQYLVLGNEDNTAIRKTIVGSVAESMIDDRTIPVLLVP